MSTIDPFADCLRLRELALFFPRKADRDELNAIADRFHGFAVRSQAQLEIAHETMRDTSTIIDEEREKIKQLEAQRDALAKSLTGYTGFAEEGVVSMKFTYGVAIVSFILGLGCGLLIVPINSSLGDKQQPKLAIFSGKDCDRAMSSTTYSVTKGLGKEGATTYQCIDIPGR